MEAYAAAIEYGAHSRQTLTETGGAGFTIMSLSLELIKATHPEAVFTLQKT
jgi:hypothetical protein